MTGKEDVRLAYGYAIVLPVLGCSRPVSHHQAEACGYSMTCLLSGSLSYTVHLQKPVNTVCIMMPGLQFNMLTFTLTNQNSWDSSL